VALLLAGPSVRPTLFPIHKYSFFLWLAATGLHVLGHLPNVIGVLSRGGGGRKLERMSSHFSQSDPLYAGRGGRTIALVSAIAPGLALALILIPQYGPWPHYHHHHASVGR
jgi:hypothetical protein